MRSVEWYNKVNPYHKYYHKARVPYYRREEALRKSTIADPLDYVGTKPDIEIRYSI